MNVAPMSLYTKRAYILGFSRKNDEKRIKDEWGE